MLDAHGSVALRGFPFSDWDQKMPLCDYEQTTCRIHLFLLTGVDSLSPEKSGSVLVLKIVVVMVMMMSVYVQVLGEDCGRDGDDVSVSVR